MANRNTQGFGLVPAGTLGQTPATSGQGKYKIDAGYAQLYIQGGAVVLTAGYIVEGQTTDAPIIRCIKWNILQRGYNFKADVCEFLQNQ